MKKIKAWLLASLLALSLVLSGCSALEAVLNDEEVDWSEVVDELDSVLQELEEEEEGSDESSVLKEESSARAEESSSKNDKTETSSGEAAAEASTQNPVNTESEDEALIVKEDGQYSSKEEVAFYLYTYGHLPSNYLTKNEAKDLGWDSSAGNLWDVAPGMSIGGDKFGNYEGLLPKKNGRQYYECDINYEGGYRGADRIIFSNDGLIYYTGDHYQSFELLYGEE